MELKEVEGTSMELVHEELECLKKTDEEFWQGVRELMRYGVPAYDQQGHWAEIRIEEAIVVDDDRWEELIALTDGAASACFQCGVCTAICPWGLVKAETVSVRTLMRQAELGLLSEGDRLWLCTSCAQCEVLCPRGVPIVEVIRGLRALAWQRRNTPHGLPSVLCSIYWNNNPWSQPPSHRMLWAKSLDLPTYDATRHEVLLYVGCTASYDQRVQRVARAVIRLLKAAGVSRCSSWRPPARRRGCGLPRGTSPLPTR